MLLLVCSRRSLCQASSMGCQEVTSQLRWYKVSPFATHNIPERRAVVGGAEARERPHISSVSSSPARGFASSKGAAYQIVELVPGSLGPLDLRGAGDERRTAVPPGRRSYPRDMIGSVLDLRLKYPTLYEWVCRKNKIRVHHKMHRSRLQRQLT